VVIVAIAIVASFLLKTFLVRSFYIPSASMENTLIGEPGHQDRILVDELVPHLTPLHRGDVIVFTDPGGWLDTPAAPPAGPVAAVTDQLLSLVGLSVQDANDHLIKRVIALPGDHVTCCNALGQMSVNGTPLNEPYVHLPAGTHEVSRDPFDQTVPAGDLWVMGDNRWNSKDSRYNPQGPTHGFVPINDVVGRAFLISWPINRWNTLPNYPDTFQAVPNQ
jgi:signal peptidase I